jgi:hypothetical protein
VPPSFAAPVKPLTYAVRDKAFSTHEFRLSSVQRWVPAKRSRDPSQRLGGAALAALVLLLLLVIVLLIGVLGRIFLGRILRILLLLLSGLLTRLLRILVPILVNVIWH